MEIDKKQIIQTLGKEGEKTIEADLEKSICSTFYFNINELNLKEVVK